MNTAKVCALVLRLLAHALKIMHKCGLKWSLNVSLTNSLVCRPLKVHLSGPYIRLKTIINGERRKSPTLIHYKALFIDNR